MENRQSTVFGKFTGNADGGVIEWIDPLTGQTMTYEGKMRNVANHWVHAYIGSETNRYMVLAPDGKRPEQASKFAFGNGLAKGNEG